MRREVKSEGSMEREKGLKVGRSPGITQPALELS